MIKPGLPRRESPGARLLSPMAALRGIMIRPDDRSAKIWPPLKQDGEGRAEYSRRQ
jgi:hypothetical protein